MTSFKVFQIHLSYLQYTILAEGKFPVPKEQWRKRIQVAMDEDAQSIDKYVSHALEEGFYDHVADIEATDLHDVFEDTDTDFRMHWVVLPTGFAPISFNREAA